MKGLGLGLGLTVNRNNNPFAPSLISRVAADGGVVRDKALTVQMTNFFKGLMPNTKLLFCPQLAVKLRESGAYKYVTKLYDLGPGMLDAAQTTALFQPYLSGNIAPNEKYTIKNPNGGHAYMTHTPISFLSTNKWSVSTILSINSNEQYLDSSLKTYLSYCGKFSYESLGLVNSSYSILSNNATQRTNSTYKFNKFGKNIVITWVALGNGAVQIHENGKLVDTLMGVNSSFVFSDIFRGRQMDYHGDIKYHCIRNIALTTQQVQDEYNYLRTLFPEIESVAIGTQTWATSNCEMTCTPQGNVIQEMQAATNVEKITNGGFENGLIGTTLLGTELAMWELNNTSVIYGLQDGKLSVTTIGDAASRPLLILQSTIPLTQGKWYKVSFKYKTLSGIASLNRILLSSSIGKTINTTLVGEGTYNIYINASESITSGYFGVNFDGRNLFSIQIDDVSLQEVGWSDSTNLYNYIYANTTGTAEKKEYEAVKAAAMWCHYNNDVALGAVYGKLYNWFAVKLLQMDIDYYNVSNPINTWGWRVPTNSDYTTLSTYLGGSDLAGGKMKKDGLTYWNTPNTGADNSSGFSAIAGGGRRADGFSTLLTYSLLYTIDFTYQSTGYGKILRSSDGILKSVASHYNSDAPIGMSLRLIKS